MVKHVLTALSGAAAGALIGVLVQFKDFEGGDDLEQLLRRMLIAGVAWGFGALSLSWGLEQARGRQWAWAVVVALQVALMSTALALAGRLMLGFATRYAWSQALFLTGAAGVGVWLGGAIVLRQRALDARS